MAHRIYAGTAGGKKYFWGEDNKLYDEAGNEQSDQYAEILKANFPKNPNQPQQPSSAPPQQPQQPGNNKRVTLTQAMAEELLRIAFPEVYKSTKRRKVNKKKKDNRDRDAAKANDKKQRDRKLSLSIDAIASNVRTNGTILQQQLAVQERSVELLQQLVKGVKGGSSNNNTISGGGLLSKLASSKWLLPALGIAGVGAAGAAAMWMNSDNKEKSADTWYDEDTEKYGTEKADELKKNRELSTFGRIKSLWDRIPDPHAPKETQKIKEAKERKPSGRTIEVKGDAILFEAKTIKLEGRNVTITGNSSVMHTTGGVGVGAGANGDTPGGDNGGGGGGGGNEKLEFGTPLPVQSKFDPTVRTPSSPGPSDPKAPGYGGITGGQGAEILGRNNNFDHKDKEKSAPAIREEIAKGQSFNPVTQEGKFGSLAEQRAGYMDQIKANPELQERMMAMMVAEEGNDSDARKALAETAMNRASSREVKDIAKIIGNKEYYAPYKDGGYDRALARLRADPKLRAQVQKELDEVGAGSDISKLATDNASAHVKANAIRRGDTLTYEGKNKEGFFRKDKNPDYHGKRVVEKTKAWAESTQAAMKAEELRKKDPTGKASAKLTGGVVTPEMTNLFGKDSIANMKGMGGIEAAKKEMDNKDEKVQAKGLADQLAEPKVDFAKETAKTARGEYDIKPDLTGVPKTKFTDELIEKKLNEEAGIQRWLGWKQIGPGVQRRKQLEQDPWNNEPGWDAPLKEVPGEIPEPKSNDLVSETKEGASSAEGAEKDMGNKAKVTKTPIKPKPIRKVDMNKYYPQYPKSDYTGQEVGIGVA